MKMPKQETEIDAAKRENAELQRAVAATNNALAAAHMQMRDLEQRLLDAELTRNRAERRGK